MGDNTRITFNGGSQTVGAMGSNATGHVYHGTPPDDPRLADIERRLAQLRGLLDTHARDLDDPDAARAAVDAASDEVRTGRPERGRMRLLLNAVTGAAPAATAVTQAVRELIQIVAATS